MTIEVNNTDFVSWGNSYCAIPYDLGASFFYFGSFEEYEAKVKALRNGSGDPVEEFMIEFIDGDGCDLFNALHIDQGSLEQWFDDFEMMEEDEITRACYLAGLGYDADTILEKLEDVYLFEGTALEYAHQYVEESGLLQGIREEVKRYFDYEAYARDLYANGDITDLRIQGTDYIVVARV